MPKVLKVNARLAGRVCDDLRRHGVAADDLLREVGLRRADIADPEARVPSVALIGLIEWAAAILGDASYGLRLGAAQEARDTGLIGFVLLNSPTLMDDLINLQHYFRVDGDGEEVEFDKAGPHSTLRFRETETALRGRRHNSEYIGERGKTYSVLLDETRSELAKHYLADTNFRLEQAAYLTGYSEPAALVRGFKRWTGTTPIQYRAQHP